MGNQITGCGYAGGEDITITPVEIPDTIGGKAYPPQFTKEYALIKRIAELEGRIELALRLNYTGQIGWIGDALRGIPVPHSELLTMKRICEAENAPDEWFKESSHG